METKEFDTVDVLMTATGRCLVERGIEGVYRVLNWMTGEDVYTLQIPRISKEAVPVLIAAHPLLSEVINDAETVNSTKWAEFRDRWIDRIGPTMAVPKMTEADHERIDPISEIAEMFPPDRLKIIDIG